ncbi:MAG: hypothetical protein ACFB0E_00830 [Leptolyngbyaceae cyanobacterium]
MTTQRVQYENLLATSSDYSGAISLLKQYRPYLEVIPSMRRPKESVVTVPLPVIKVRQPIKSTGQAGPQLSAQESVLLPCDLAMLMCDPEWKIKTGVEILVFIHRPDEDFSDLLMRWRQTQILLDGSYEWSLPARYQHLLTDSGSKTCPLFVVFDSSPERIAKGLKGAGLPAITYADSAISESTPAAVPPLDANELDVEAAEEFDFADLDDIGNSEMTSE